MELEKYFIKDKKNSAEAIMKIYNELNEMCVNIYLMKNQF